MNIQLGTDCQVFGKEEEQSMRDKERLQGIPADISAEASLLLPEVLPQNRC